MTAVVIAIAASIPAVTAFASSFGASGHAGGTPLGPPQELRPAASVSGDWERSYNAASPSPAQLGVAVLAAADDKHRWEVLKAMLSIADQRQADQQAAVVAANAEAKQEAVAEAVPYSANSASGFESGTTMLARITIYGCAGPGGGFCNHMANGGAAFEGAAACSENLPFGTRLTIQGDPTGRTYECLDRGSLAPTWIDVYFYDTSDGIAWQSTLGGTLANIHIVN